MLGARLIAIGAGIALAVHGVVAADQATTTRLHITLRAGTVHADEHVQIKQYEDPNPTVSYGNGGSSDDATGSDDGSNDSGDYGTEGSGESNSCDYGWSEVTVEGAYGVFCVEDTPCGDAFGACPGPQAGLEQGSYCAQDGYGSYVCKEGFRPVDYSWSDDLNPVGGGEYPPGSQSGTGDDPNPVYKTCGEWQSPMSVEGVEGIFCVYGLPCVRAIMGSCPEPQDGLPYGAYCGTVASGVFGCKPVTEDMFHNQEIPTDDSGSGGVTTYEHQCEDGLTPMSVEHIPGVFCIEGPVCVADTPGSCPGPQYGLEFGAYCGEVETGVLGCKAYSAWPTDTGSGSDEYPDYGDDSGSGPTMTIEPPPVYTNVCSAPDETPMSVEGVEGTFCVSGQACAGVDGTCPGPQAGLELGSHCGLVASGVLGCLPGPAFCSGPGDSQMSVEGVNGVFCVNGQACAGVDGACPGPQPGLELGSYCGIVASGVKGCVPNVAPALRAHKKHKQTSRKH